MNLHTSNVVDTTNDQSSVAVEQNSTHDDEIKHHESAPPPAVEVEETSGLKGKISQSDELQSPVKASRTADEEEEVSKEVGGRERIKRHRVEVAGRVWIPEIWGQEDLLKDWTDCSGFEASLMNSTIMSARAALIEEGRRANSTTLRMEGSC